MCENSKMAQIVIYINRNDEMNENKIDMKEAKLEGFKEAIIQHQKSTATIF